MSTINRLLDQLNDQWMFTEEQLEDIRDVALRYALMTQIDSHVRKEMEQLLNEVER